MDQQDIERLWKRAADAITRAKFCANDSEVQAAAEAFKRATTDLEVAALRAEQRAKIAHLTESLEGAKRALAAFERLSPAPGDHWADELTDTDDRSNPR